MIFKKKKLTLKKIYFDILKYCRETLTEMDEIKNSSDGVDVKSYKIKKKMFSVLEEILEFYTNLKKEEYENLTVAIPFLDMVLMQLFKSLECMVEVRKDNPEEYKLAQELYDSLFKILLEIKTQDEIDFISKEINLKSTEEILKDVDNKEV